MEGKTLEELGHEFTGADAHFAGAAHPGEHFGMLHARALLDGIREFLLAAVNDLLALADEVVRIFNRPFIRGARCLSIFRLRVSAMWICSSSLLSWRRLSTSRPMRSAALTMRSPSSFCWSINLALRIWHSSRRRREFSTSLLFLPQLFQPQLGLFHIGVHLVSLPGNCNRGRRPCGGIEGDLVSYAEK